MSVDFNYFSTSRPDALADGLSAVDTAVVLADGSTFPDPALYGGKPYTIILAYGTSREEVCTVTAKPSATTLTVTRGQDGTAATTKNAGDVVVHGVSARDFVAFRDKAPTASPAFTGNPTAPTPAAGDNDTSIATTAFVTAAVLNAMPTGAILPYGGAVAPTGWHLCDGTAHGSTALQAVIGSANTPDLRDRFIVGAGSTYAVGATGGAASVTLTGAQSGVFDHTHGVTVNTSSVEHTHSINHDHPAASTTSATPTITLNYTTGVEAGDEVSGSGVNYITSGVDLGAGGTPLTATEGPHSHSVDLPAFTGTSGLTSTGGAHAHTATAAGSGYQSASSPHENRPPYYALTYIIRK